MLVLLLAGFTAAACHDAQPLGPQARPGGGVGSLEGGASRALVTSDPDVLAARLRESGTRHTLLVWVKEPGTLLRAPDSFVPEGTQARLSIGLPAGAAGEARRSSAGRSRVPVEVREQVAVALAREGAEVRDRGERLPFLAVTVPDAQLQPVLRVLLRHPAVDYVEASEARPMTTYSRHRASSSGDRLDAKLGMHRVLDAWTYTRGAGVRVGVIDSGLAGWPGSGLFHEDARLAADSSGVVALGFVDDIEGDPGTNGGGYAFDDYGHGTEMVGLVGANANGSGAIGVMPGGLTFSLKAAFNTHLGSTRHCGMWPWQQSYFCLEADDFVRAVDFACANGIKVLSMSFGGDLGSSERDALYRAYHQCDILLMAGTGNAPADAGKAPASYSFVVGVGALDGQGGAIYVTQNRSVSAYAFGHTTVASCPGSAYCSPNGAGYSDGTSAATATAAGIAGLLRAHVPSMTAPEAWFRLVRTAVGPNHRLDAEAALLYILPVASSIDGPRQTSPNQVDTWTVHPSGGTPPYRHEWRRGGALVSTGTTYTGDSGWSDFVLEVTTQDVRGRSTTSSAHVYVSTMSGPCPDPTDPTALCSN